MAKGTWRCKACMCVLIGTFIVFLTTQFADAYPTVNMDIKEYTEERPRKPTLCEKHKPTEEVCQRCAKSTKSTLVYPLCCNDEDDVLFWCERYLGFGIHKR